MTALAHAPIVRVLPPRPYPSMRAVIEAIGDAMVDAAAVEPSYVDGMLRKEQETSTIVMAEVALPHGTADVRGAVRRNALVIAPIPNGVAWTRGHRVRLAIGVAGTGDEAHMRLLASLARVLSDDQRLNQLKKAAHEAPVDAWFDGVAT